MNYNLANQVELKAARNRISYLARKKRRATVKEIQLNRTLSQNSYLHLIIGAFGEHFGYTLEEAKHIYKQVNKDIYFYTKKKRQFIRSSADLNKEEMAKTIDRFMQASEEAGYKLPLATDREWLLQIENEIERSRRYL
jgi:S-methylmethionine-dependent homocysteine/selenocysteine methylase